MRRQDPEGRLEGRRRRGAPMRSRLRRASAPPWYEGEGVAHGASKTEHRAAASTELERLVLPEWV